MFNITLLRYHSIALGPITLILLLYYTLEPPPLASTAFCFKFPFYEHLNTTLPSQSVEKYFSYLTVQRFISLQLYRYSTKRSVALLIIRDALLESSQELRTHARLAVKRRVGYAYLFPHQKFGRQDI